MVCDCSSCATAGYFDEAKARQELGAYHRSGPGKTTRRLIAGLKAVHAGGSLLDVGSGSGVLTLELLQAGATEATCVDLSAGSIQVAGEEAARQGVANRITWREGDFVDIGRDLPPAEIVTLDRVVCCYPSYRPLLEEAAKHSRRWLALSFPRDRWYVHIGLRLENLWLRLRNNPFRAFVHPVSAMDAVVREAGFVAVHHDATLVWQTVVYARSQGNE